MTSNQDPDTLFGKAKKKTFWKIVIYDSKRKEIRSLYRGFPYILGKNSSNRINKDLSLTERYSSRIDKGIHVYTTKQKAKNMIDLLKDNCPEVIIPVVCYKKDLVAIGVKNDAVFMKVLVEERSIKRLEERYS